VLWFLDVSKNGSRRWCRMDVCGNRAKVGRYNRRQRASGEGP
jgi:predicted RNA-binding Zn ribbon-like protein